MSLGSTRKPNTNAARARRTAASSRTQQRRASKPRLRAPLQPQGGLSSWLRMQALNVRRHTSALRPFTRDEFGNHAASPTEAHIQAANDLILSLREPLADSTRRVQIAIEMALRSDEADRPAAYHRVLSRKQSAHNRVQAVERVWDFYFELFGQRQSQFGNWLLGCDRIALDAYQAAFLGIGTAKSIPAPPPFAYMRTGFSPATFRRGIRLRQLGRRLNPFPLIQLPYHRMVNPWTLGAILHEVSHNLQNELGLAEVIPRVIARRLATAGMPRSVIQTWVRWNRELFADLSGLLLGGPAVVGSLMDVIGRSKQSTVTYQSTGPHPTPYLRTLLSIELLRRMGFTEDAERYCRTWTSLYRNPRAGTIPEPLLRTFADAKDLIVDTVCFQPFAALGNKTLAQVFRFATKEQQIIEEAARRLAQGNDPGVVPERFLIGATRVAVERKLAAPGTIAENFYRELARR